MHFLTTVSCLIRHFLFLKVWSKFIKVPDIYSTKKKHSFLIAQKSKAEISAEKWFTRQQGNIQTKRVLKYKKYRLQRAFVRQITVGVITSN